MGEPPRQPRRLALWGRIQLGKDQASRTRSGSTFMPASSHDRTMRVTSRSAAHCAASRFAGAGVGIERGAQPRASRNEVEKQPFPTGMPSASATSGERQVEVVVQNHHRSMVDGEPPEAALELVAIDDQAQAIRGHRLIGRQQAEVRRPATSPASLGVTGAHEEAVRPGLKACRVAELRKVPPDAQQRLLRRILGKAEVAQDPVRRGKEPIGPRGSEGRECPLVAVLREFHEIGVHALFRLRHRFRPMLHTVWGQRPIRTSIFAAGRDTRPQPYGSLFAFTAAGPQPASERRGTPGPRDRPLYWS